MKVLAKLKSMVKGTQPIQIPDSGVLVDALVATPDFPGVRLPSSGYAVDERCGKKDRAGNEVSGYLQTNGNDTMIHLFIKNPQGVVSRQASVVARGPQGQVLKMNSAYFYLDGPDVVTEGTGYELTSPERTHYPVRVVWPNVVVPFAEGEDPESGVGALTHRSGGPAPNPSPGLSEEDLDAIETRMLFIAESLIVPEVHERSLLVIQNIIPKVMFAFINGLNEGNQDPTAIAFRNALFPYLKNAAANPLQNGVLGQDDWGAVIRNGLKSIVREVLDERGE